MSPLKKLINQLEAKRIKYRTIEHRKVYTAFDAAQTQRIKPQAVAKTLLIKGDSDFYLAVIPGHKRLDPAKFKKILNKYLVQSGKKVAKKITIASESQIKRNFTKKTGALTPFGNLYRCQTFIDKSLLKNSKINLNAGSFTESLEMTPVQYKKFEKPVEGSFSKAH